MLNLMLEAMSRTIKYKVSKTKGKMPKLDKGTKTAIRVKMMKELENDDYLELDRVE
jgi:hypothetical protein